MLCYNYSHLVFSSFRSYDVYTTQEPGVFEAMALVHSRIRRVVFGIPNKVDGGLGGTGMQTAVQSLPTNHHYRAFYCAPETHLYQKCKDIHSSRIAPSYDKILKTTSNDNQQYSTIVLHTLIHRSFQDHIHFSAQRKQSSLDHTYSLLLNNISRF